MNFLPNVDMFMLMNIGGNVNNAPSAVSSMGNVILSIIAVIVIVIIAFHLLRMMGQRQYAQAMVLLCIGGFVTWYLVNPSAFMNFFSNIFNAMF